MVLLLALSTLAVQPARAGERTFQGGDIFVSIGSGNVQWYDHEAELIATLSTGASQAFTLGLNADGLGNLYVAAYDAAGLVQSISRFAPDGTLLGTFGGGFDADPQSLVFDQNGNLLVGQASGNADVLKFDPAGNLIDRYDVQTGPEGSDHLALAPDGRTLFYTSGGTAIHRYDLVTRQQLPDYTHVLRGVARNLKLLRDGTILVANEREVVRMDANRNVLQTYDQNLIDRWYDVALDPDGVTFWACSYAFAGYCARFNIATGAIVKDFATTKPTTFGIFVYPDSAPGAPDAPSNLTATLGSAGGSPVVNLEWDDNSDDETAFVVERKSDIEGYGILATLGANVTSFVDNAVSEGRTYTYRVRAQGAAGVSGPSNEASATIPGVPPGGTIKVKTKLNFGSSGVGDSRTKTLKIRNVNREQTLTVIVRDPAPAGVFARQSPTNTVTIGPGETASVDFAFTPDRKGKVSGTVVLETSDPAQRSVTIALSGKGK